MRYFVIKNESAFRKKERNNIILTSLILIVLLIVDFTILEHNEAIEIIIFFLILYLALDIFQYIFKPKRLEYIEFGEDSILIVFNKSKYNKSISLSNIKSIVSLKTEIKIKQKKGNNYKIPFSNFDYNTVVQLKNEISEIKARS